LRSDERAPAEEAGEELDVLREGIDWHDPDRDVRSAQRVCLHDQQVTVVLRVVEIAHQHQGSVRHAGAAEGILPGREPGRDSGAAAERAPRTRAEYGPAVVGDTLRSEEAQELLERARRRVRRQQLVTD